MFGQLEMGAVFRDRMIEPYEAVGRVSEGCPIGCLVADIVSRRRPSLAWVVQWSRNGEPLHEAWQNAYDDTAMRLLLRAAGHPLGYRPAKNPMLKCFSECRFVLCFACCNAIRSAAHRLLTLTELLDHIEGR